jgi:hypothetical protein
LEYLNMASKTTNKILIFILGMLTFAIGSWVLSTFILPQRPTQAGTVEDWGKVCFWQDQDGIYGSISPKGCYSSTCTRIVQQAGTAVVNLQGQAIALTGRFVLASTSRFPLPCSGDCLGGGAVQFRIDGLIPNDYEVWFGDQRLGQVKIFSGLPTPRQCFENGPTRSPEATSAGVQAPLRLTPEGAAALIADSLAGKKPGLADASALQLMELPERRVWEQLEAQIFIVTEGSLQNEAFLIRHGRAVQLGAAAGGQGLTSLAVTDLDRDGQPELLFSYNAGLGPGIGPGTQTRVGLYQPGAESAQPTIEAGLAYLGIAGLRFEDPATVKLAVIEPPDGSQALRYLDSLGQLALEPAETGQSLIFEMEPDLAQALQQKIILQP